MSSLFYVGVPIALLIAAGALVRGRGNPDTAGRRYFLFLTWTGLGLLGAMVAENWLMGQPAVGYTTLLAPATAGVMALFFLHLPEWSRLRPGQKALTAVAPLFFTATAAALIWTGLAGGGWRSPERAFLILAILSIGGLLALAWTTARHYPAVLGLGALGCLALFHVTGMGELPFPAEPPPAWLPAVSVAVYLVFPGLVVAAAAALIETGLKAQPSPASWRPAVGRLALAALLLAGLIYTFIWGWIWDGTDDGLRGLAMLATHNLAAAAAGMAIGMVATGWRRWAGLAFTLLVVGGLWAAVSFGNTITYHTVTEARAAQVQAALARYQAKTGSYPANLEALVPGELWWVPEPMILRGEGWCYEGGADYYRLGAVYREYWSTPFIEIRVYASAGEPPAAQWICDERLAALKPEYELAFQPAPTPIPLPTSAISVPRTTLLPVVRAPSLTAGSWSPDGAYFVFGLTEFYGEHGDQVQIDLRFLNAASGQVCRASEPVWTAGPRSDGLGDHAAWLPDGRLLYVAEAGRMVALSPCADGVEELTGRYPVTFTRVASFDEDRGRILLSTSDAIWLLDGASLEARPIQGVAPGPADAHWAGYAWSPGGERLAISLMSAPAASDEAALHIVNGATGEVERRLRLAGASEASLPIVDWLTQDELLLQGRSLRVMDLRSDPPQMTDLLREVFLLDIAYPTDVGSVDFVRDPAGGGYYIGVQVNHPRNQAAYVYGSESGQVEVLQHDSSTLLFFPGGRWMRLLKWEDTPTYRDEYALAWLDRPGETERLAVEGHTPRSHPQIFPRYLPTSSHLIFNSSQGVSLVSLPDGKTVGFWELAGGGGRSSMVYPAPAARALVIAADGDGLYYLRLPADEAP